MSDQIDQAEIAELRQQMLKFAMLQLRDEQLAEDAVQEALLGALKNIEHFQQRAQVKTWVFGILKHKIVDVLRAQKRQLNLSELAEPNTMEQLMFDRREHWQSGEAPQAWHCPAASALSADFWQVFETCLTHLPEAQARLFMMREFVELEADEICQLHNISHSNLYVMLYRARIRLRECLTNKWFQEV
ncbi:sigma-70 family RNA polymerase sigma factor [Shewanella mangrovi]|uniref:sigma-70 family RNA polymerase sigma factor n=1 Tax=Shewanella mangrovi TaxID=1515746 RepID=UPI000B0182FC|nr:sigma-70 family RNA polymerase sigma factor [Shewanella mangrovi]